MSYKENFIAWKEQYKAEKGNKPSKELQIRKLLEFKRISSTELGEPYTPEKNVENAIAIAEESGDVQGVERLKAMQEDRLGQYGVQQLPYGERYVSRITGNPKTEFEAKLLRAQYPRLFQSIEKGDSFSPLAASLDVASAPGRFIESGISTLVGGEDGFLDRAAKLETGDFVSDIVRDPYSLVDPTKTTRALSSGLPLFKRAAGYALEGLRGQVPASILGQVEKMERGEDASLSEFATELATGSLFPVSAKAIKKTFQPIKEFSKDILSEATGRSRDLLQTIGTRELKEWARQAYQGQKAKPDEVLEKLRGFSDNAESIANDVIKKVDDFDKLYIEKNDTIKKALSKMPKIDALPIINILNSAKMELPKANIYGQSANLKGYGGEIAFNEQIDGLINRINQKIKSNNPYMGIGTKRGTAISAEDMLDIRRDIDRSIDWNAETFSKAFFNPIQKLKKNARTFIKNDLENSAENIGDKTYAPAMKEFSRILNLQDKVKRNIMPRANDLGETDRATNFLLRLSSPNKIDAKIFAKNFEAILGKDLFKEADFLRLSKEYRDALPIANDIKTGRKNWLQGFMDTTGGKIATFPLSSPKLAAPLMEVGGYLTDKSSYLSPMMQRILPVGIEESIEGER